MANIVAGLAAELAINVAVYAAAHVVAHGVGHAISSNRRSGIDELRARHRVEFGQLRQFQLPAPLVTEEESADRSVLDVFPEQGIECKVCMNTTCRDQLSVRVCVSESSSKTSDVFACIKEHPICSECAERMRTQGQNRCPFCRQPDVFRKPRSASAEVSDRNLQVRRFWEEDSGAEQNHSALQFWEAQSARNLEQDLFRFYSTFNTDNLNRTREIAYAYQYRVDELNRRLQEQYGHDLSDIADDHVVRQQHEYDVNNLQTPVFPTVLVTAPPLEAAVEDVEESVAAQSVQEPVVRRLRAFYREHNAELVDKANEVAANFRGRENDLNWKLRQKYGRDLSSLPTRIGVC